MRNNRSDVQLCKNLPVTILKCLSLKETPVLLKTIPKFPFWNYFAKPSHCEQQQYTAEASGFYSELNCLELSMLAGHWTPLVPKEAEPPQGTYSISQASSMFGGSKCWGELSDNWVVSAGRSSRERKHDKIARPLLQEVTPDPCFPPSRGEKDTGVFSG